MADARGRWFPPWCALGPRRNDQECQESSIESGELMIKNSSRETTRGWVGATWGSLGVVLLIGGALVRLAPMGVDAFSHPLDWVHWTALAAWVPFMAWSEGYRGFHRAFAPMVASRARYLRDHPEKTHYVVLAPLF